MPFPATSVLDNFNRADENPLANGNWTGPIENGNSQLKLATNVVTSAAAAQGTSYWSAQQFNADQEAFCDISHKTGASGKVQAIWLRVQNPNNASTAAAYIVIAASLDNLMQFYKLTSGHTYTHLGSDISQTMTAGDSFGARITGTTLEGWYLVAGGSWTQLGTRSDGSISGAGYIGAEVDDQSGTIDNFGGGNVSGIVVPTLALLGVGT